MIAVSAFAIRVALIFAFEAQVIESDWQFGYETGRTARSLAVGEGFSSPFKEPSGPTAWLMPAYPALLAVVFKTLGIYSRASALAILLLNCAIAALTSLVVYRLADRTLGSSTALLAAGLFALYPPSIWHSINTIWDTSLLALTMILLVDGVYYLKQSPRLAPAVTLGLAVGAALWVSAVFLSLLPLVWFFVLHRQNQCRKRKLAQALLVTVVAFAAVSPWMVRNEKVFGKPFLRSNLGLELELGNNDRSWDHYVQGSDSSLFLLGHPSISEKEFERYIELGEVEYVDQAFGKAIRFVSENPLKFLRLTLWRIEVFWLSDLRVENEWTGNLAVSTPLSWMRAASHLLPLPFFVAGVIIALKRRLDVGPLLGAMLVFPLPYYITHVSERYRFPIEPLLLIIASFGLLWVTRLVRSRLAGAAHEPARRRR